VAEQNRFLDLSDYWRMVRKRLWLPIVFAVIVAGLAAAFVMTKTPTYLARAKVQVLPIVNPLIGTSNLPASAIEVDMATEAEIVSSVDVAEIVRENLPTETPAGELLRGVRVDLVGDSSVMYIGYEDENNDSAQRLANAFAEAYLQNRIAGAQATLDEKIRVVNGRIDEARLNLRAAESGFERTVWAQQLQDLQAQRTELENVQGGLEGGRLYSRAILPETPTGVGLPPVIIGGALLGALIGAILAIGRGLLEDRIEDRHELSEQIDAPVLGVIPSVEGWSDRERADLVMATEPGGAAAEAYRTLATNVRFLRSQHLLDVIVVSSALPGEGKSATAANVAWALAETGLRVVLVDADLRRPRASEFFGVPEGPGFRDALEGISVRELLVDTDVEGLSLLGSGATPHDPVSLLAQAGRAMAELRSIADVIITDSPPVLPVADASILAELGDGVILVHDPSISSRTALEEAVAQLTTAGGSIIGGAYNNISVAQRLGLGFSNYDTYYGPDERAASASKRRQVRETPRRPSSGPPRPTRQVFTPPVEPPVESSVESASERPSEPPTMPVEPPMPVEPDGEGREQQNGEGTTPAPIRGGGGTARQRNEH
jgi:capsular exopolysaccharide synthesis family protein